MINFINQQLIINQQRQVINYYDSR